MIFTRSKGFGGEFGATAERASIRRGIIVSNSIMRYPKSAALTGLAVVTRGMEFGFIAAGITVAAIAVVQSLGIVLSWI